LGLSSDEDQALEWFRKAADGGDANAPRTLEEAGILSFAAVALNRNAHRHSGRELKPPKYSEKPPEPER
jgi:TPR repeat protein